MTLAPNTWLILALGNPGEEYENSYHNAGMLALPAIVEAFTGETVDALDWKSHKKLFAYATFGDFIFTRSLTFMNESGRAAAEAVKKFSVAPERLVVIHDESDVPLGEFKLSFDRNSGGHKGAQSVIDQLNTKMFWRLRIGIRPTRETRRKKAGDFVLAPITPGARKKIESVFREASEKLKEVTGN
jgi:PTH1 family peptidyl-tRNA hydrolase